MNQAINLKEKLDAKGLEVTAYSTENMIVMVESVYEGEKNIQELLEEYLKSRKIDIS